MKLDHLVIKSADLEASQKFYEMVLPEIGFSAVGAHHWRNDHDLNIVLKPAPDQAQAYDRSNPGLNHFAFNTETEEAFDAIIDRLAMVDIALPEVQTFANGKSIFIPDPDGLRLEIMFEIPPTL